MFATSFIVYRKEAKPLKLNRGSAGLYIQTPINTAVSSRHSPPEFLLKARRVLARNARLLGEGVGGSCCSVSQRLGARGHASRRGEHPAAALAMLDWPSSSFRGRKPPACAEQACEAEEPVGPSHRVCEGGGWSRLSRRPPLLQPKPPAIN